MSAPGRIYAAILRTVGVIAIVGAGSLVVWGLLRHSGGQEELLRDLVIVALIVPTSWLRINFEPKGYVTLAPLVVFTGFLLADTPMALFAAGVSPLAGAAASGRLQWANALGEGGAEAIAALVGIVLLSLVGVQLRTPGSVGWLAPFVIASAGYICLRFVLAAVDAKASQGVRFLTYTSAAGKSIAAILILLALLAVGVSYLSGAYGGANYFLLAIATIAIVEAANPFKQLSDQWDVLFASLGMVAHAIDLKDAYTGRHARVASDIAVRIARAMRLPEPEVRKIRFAGLLHDIGKIGVSGKIIRKPSTLNTEEMAEMRQHPVIGAEIMRPVQLLADASEIVRHHHEHFDGSGYPDGLRGERIPMGSRIVLVADAFNAITTDRTYRKARSKAVALEVLKKNTGTQFDPQVVQALEGVIHLLP